MTENVHRRAAERVGTSLRDKYTLEKLIGVGGAGAVYAGRHRNGMAVALKVLHPGIADLEGARRRFLREGYLANRIDHPGVVRVLDDDEDKDGSVFLAMELLHGRTLEDEWLASEATLRQLEVARVVAIAREVVDVLEAAERAGIVHRDLKPANVFVLAGVGAVKILDFGIARLLDGPRSTPTGDAIGSPEFTAPEQARGHGHAADARTDIYALGAMMFTLLSGHFVHATKNPLERMILTATTPAQAIHRVMPDLDDELAHVIDVALSFDRAQRWPSASSFREALDEVNVER